MRRWPQLIAFVVGCELVGLVGTPFTLGAIPTWYATLNKPFFAPPNWIFGPVWTLLYALMGVSFWLIWKQGEKKATKGRSIPGEKKVTGAGLLFLTQLSLNFLWTLVFFGLRAPLWGLIIIVTLWVFILLTMRRFYLLSKTAGYLLVPYFLWVTFAMLLNAAIVLLN